MEVEGEEEEQTEEEKQGRDTYKGAEYKRGMSLLMRALLTYLLCRVPSFGF